MPKHSAGPSFFVITAQFFLLAIAILTGCNPGKPQAEVRPNFLVIITDDQRYDTMDFMPITQARIFEQGVSFTRGYVTTPACCPSRASILTGMYAHKHGVYQTPDPLIEKTFVEYLHEAGYFTGYVGKYLNSWDGSARGEFDFWVGTTSNGSKYLNPRLNIDGSWQTQEGYLTYILRDFALQFLEAAAAKQPFFLIFAPKTPHPPGLPAPGDEELYPDLLPYRPPSYNEQDVSSKPAWMSDFKTAWLERRGVSLDMFRRRQLQSLNSLDAAIGEMLDLLQRKGILESTVIFYTSDNGYLWGEHSLAGKAVAYEEATRVPFAVRYPQLVAQARVDEHLVANIDIAPTIYQLAGLEIPPEVDGRSLVPLLQGNEDWREDLLLEAWPQKHPAWVAVHTRRYVYVETDGDIAELYDLEEDPYQLENRALDPAYADIVADMKGRLERLRGE